MSRGYSASTPPPENRPTTTATVSLAGTFHSAELRAIIDTGGQVTLVSPSVVAALNAVLHDASPPIVGVDGKAIEIGGLIEFQLQIPPLPRRTICASVASHALRGTDLLVGMDCLIEFDFAIRRGVFEAI